jgi:hypothetical protein
MDLRPQSSPTTSMGTRTMSAWSVRSEPLKDLCVRVIRGRVSAASSSASLLWTPKPDGFPPKATCGPRCRRHLPSPAKRWLPARRPPQVSWLPTLICPGGDRSPVGRPVGRRFGRPTAPFRPPRTTPCHPGRGRAHPGPSHNTGHAGPHTAVRRASRKRRQGSLNPVSPWVCQWTVGSRAIIVTW